VKIYISADMEGISGVVSHAQVDPPGPDYERARHRMTREVNLVIDAAFEHGAREVVVNDSHNDMDNILYEDLDPRAHLISGSPKPLSMMQGIDETFDAVFFVGYHARGGTPKAVMDHTYASKVFRVDINGKPMSEAGLNGRVAGYFGVPVALLTGDQSAVRCAREDLGELVGIVVKEGISRTSALLYPLQEVDQRLRAGVAKAMANIDNFKPTVETSPIELAVTFTESQMAARALIISGVHLRDGRTVVYRCQDYLELFNVFRNMLSLA
jgi:D-amino peptidase